MKHFNRSLKYLKPYKARLAMSVLCVVCISVLWGGGLGLLGPGGKILLSDEGLHGWSYITASGDRLQGSISLMTVPHGTQITPEEPLVHVLSVHKVKEAGPAAAAGIIAGDWVVGVYDADASHKVLSALAVSKILAQAPKDATVSLRVFNPLTRSDRTVNVAMGKPRFGSDLLLQAVSRIPEPQDSADKYKLFLGVVILGLLVTYVRDFFRVMQDYLVSTTVVRAIMDIRSEAYDVALRLPMTFFSRHGTTDTISRFVKDTNVLSEGQTTLFGKTLAEPFNAVASVVVALCFSWKLTLIALVAGPPAAILIRYFGKQMRRASKKSLQGWSVLLAVLNETLTGIRVVKAYTMEGTERRRFFRSNRELFAQQKKMAWIDAMSGPSIESMGLTAAMGAAALAGYWVLYTHEMEATDFLVVMGCLAAMFDPVRKLSKVFTRFQQSDAAAARVFEVIDGEQEKVVHGAPMLPRHARDIELRNVCFRYPGASEDALKNINLTIPAGQTVAVVGPNGCGKTTLVSLIPRLLDPTSGQVLIDGHDVSQYSIRSLRRQIGLVTQDAVLFHASIGENVAYGLRRPRQADVLAAARKAFVDEFVRELPEGYETMVGEHGATLSGGQKQRISIARAILRDPAILIFDEATSQIDADSEQRIHQAMDEFIKDRTALMIAHRFQTVRQAHQIVVMNAGRIEAVGTHEELMTRCPLYENLYRTQLGE